MDRVSMEATSLNQKNQEERIFDLECQVSMLSDYILQLVGELGEQGIFVSDKLND